MRFAINRCPARLISVIACLISCSTPAVFAQEAAEAQAADRLALRRGVEALLTKIRDEENPDRAVFPVISQKKIIGKETEQVVVHYERITVTVPVFKNHYETKEVIVPVKQGSVTVMKKVARRVLVRREKIGERQVERLRRNPEGEITKTHTRVKILRGPGGPDIESMNWVGRNAMALYALLEAGVSPENETALEELALTINGHLGAHGLPDNTFDLAWATAALSRYPGKRFNGTVEKLTGKIIAGQLNAKEGRGLWGPVCVNAEHLKAVVIEFEKVEAAAAKLKGLGLNARNQDEPDKRVLELQTARENISWVFSLVSRNGPWFAMATRAWTIPGNEEAGVQGRIVSGWPYNIYQSNLADLQSTSLALFALRVAHDHDMLADRFDYPLLRGVRDQPLAKPIQTRQQLTQTLQSLTRMHDPRKGWDEGILWQPNATFARLNETYKGAPVPIPDRITSHATPICNAYAASALSDLSILLGEKATARYSTLTLQTASKIGTRAQPVFDYLSTLGPKGNALKRPKNDMPLEEVRIFKPIAGGQVEPYTYFESMRLSAVSVVENPGQQEVYSKMIAWLVDRQLESGLWPSLEWQTWVSTPAERAYAHAHVNGMLNEKVNRANQAKTAMAGLQKISPLPRKQNQAVHDGNHYLATTYAVMTLTQATGPLEGYANQPKDPDGFDDLGQ